MEYSSFLKYNLFFLAAQTPDYFSFNYRENYHENLTLDSISIEDKTIEKERNKTESFSSKNEFPNNFHSSSLPPIHNSNNLKQTKENSLSFDERCLSGLTNRQIFEKVFRNSKIIKNESAILDYLSLKKKNIENRVFGDDSKSWDWKYDFKLNQYTLPEFGNASLQILLLLFGL